MIATHTPGCVYGVGVGPGDPELLTLKAVNIIEKTRVIAYLVSKQGRSQAREIVAQWLNGQREVPIPISCQTDRALANQAYDEAATILSEELTIGRDVAILCEGDPLFYGSFNYLFQRLGKQFPCTVIPGVNSVSAVAAVTGRSLAAGDERLAVIPATASAVALHKALSGYDNVAIMKPGRHRPQILQLLQETGRIGDAVYVEQATRPAQRIVPQVANLELTPGPYFAMFLVTRGGGQ
jgi:precorrin-2/cobalt-factor-2 C20-methyltransferase